MINFTFFEIKIPGAKVLNSIGKSEFDKENIDEVTNFNTKPKSLTQVRNVAHGPDCLVGRGGGYSEFCLPFLYVSGDCTMTPFLFPAMSCVCYRFNLLF